MKKINKSRWQCRVKVRINDLRQQRKRIDKGLCARRGCSYLASIGIYCMLHRMQIDSYPKYTL